MIKKYLTFRVWILIIALVLSFIAIRPDPYAEGIAVATVAPESMEAQNGIAPGDIILSVEGNKINNIADFQLALNELSPEPREITVRTDNGTFVYNATDDIMFDIVNNTITDIKEDVISGSKLISINNEEFDDNLDEIIDKVLPKKKIMIKTDKGQIAYLSRTKPQLTAKALEKSNIKFGLDLVGGTRVLLKPVADRPISDQEIIDIIKIMSNRLNVYGLADLSIRSASDFEGNKFIMVEVPGATIEEARDIIARQGKFEAKIGDITVFIGGDKDITFVCRNDGSCSGIRQCNEQGSNNWACTFEFGINLSPEAAKRHAETTDKLEIIPFGGSGRDYLNETIDFYLDDKLVDSLQISSTLKGKESTGISISGPGTGATRIAAIENAGLNMDKLQTILITGSLPFGLEIVKLDSISPRFGSKFTINSIIVGLVALAAIAIVIIIRYRSLKTAIPVMITAVCEVIITLGIAAAIKWNLDMASIAGIIAAVGTGVDDQIVIIDEFGKGHDRLYAIKERIKRAFFIIIAAYFTTLSAMIPLFFAGAGLIRGFAVTTIIGITIGVFITRPAFGSFIEKINE